MTLKNLLFCIVVLASHCTAFGQNSYRCVDPRLQLDVIHSDPEAFYISMDMDPRGNLYVGGRDAVYLFAADGKGGFKERKTITTLPKNKWAYSLQVSGDDLYLLTVTALYRLPNAVRDPDKVDFERLVWGIPLGHIHQGFHGMRMGPDGSLYIAYGDPQPGVFRSKTNGGHVWHWTFLSGPDAKLTPWTGVGGVIRYDPKYHDLDVVSRGLRNICDLDFDERWNLFGNDNDQEGTALHTFGRLIHATEGSHYQWSRGWLAAKEPYRNDLIETIDPDLGRFVPFGTCYYNEDHLGDAYGRSLFVARWGSRELGQFPLQTRGASFSSAQKPLLTGKGTARPVAVFTGNDGRLFASICFMERNEASPVKQTDLVVISNPKRPLKAHAYDPSTANVGKLLDEIESPSWKRRFNAHREIISRGVRSDRQIRERFLKSQVGSMAWYSLAWLAGANDDQRVVGALTLALSSNDAQVVATAADVLRRFHQLEESQVKSLLVHESPIAQLAGLRAADGLDLRESISALALSDDSLVRQAAQRWLGRHSTWTQIEQRFNAGELPARRAALATAMWKWTDTVENGTIPDAVKISPAAKKHLSSFGYLDDPKSNLETESAKHRFTVGGLPLKDWWQQTASSDPAAPVLQRMIAQSIDDAGDSHRKTAAVFANTLGMDDLAARVPGLMQTRSIQANLVEGAKLSADKALPPAYRAIDWATAWKKGSATTGHTLFQQRCVACHDSGQGGGIIGPSLAGVAKRFTPQYLAESVVVPSKDISPNFQTWSIKQEKGRSREWLGFLSGEDENRVTLQMMDGSLKAIDKSTITSKAASLTSLMPVGLITGPEELIHIVKFLMEPESVRKPDEFIDVLAGGDLKEFFETSGNWTLSEDGVAHLQPRPGETNWKRYGDYLWLKQAYRDFDCEFEYRHEKGGNSGFYFNVPDRQNAVGPIIEVQIRDSAGAAKIDAHGITGGILPGIAPTANTARPAGEWNQMKVASRGGKITVTLNGKLVNETTLAHPNLQKKAKQGYLGFQDHGLPFSLRKIRIRGHAALPSLTSSSTPSPAPAPARRKRPATAAAELPLNPTVANPFPFAATEARFVRVQIHATTRGGPCLDEVEVHSPGSSENIALQSYGAKATASSVLEGRAKHQIEHLNDGKFGNDHSWIGAERTGWVQIELAKTVKIDRVVLSRDRGGRIANRTPTSFDILISTDGEEWITVKEVRPTKATNAPRRKTAAKVKVAPPMPAPAPPDDEPDFTPIFNGKNLDQWDHRKGAWEVADGSISCTGKEKTRNWIIWRGGSPSDFVLRLDFKYAAGNSGVQVRSDDQGDHQVFGYQVEIAPQAKMGLWHHSLLGKDDPSHGARFFMATAGQEVTITADGTKSVTQVAPKDEIVAHFHQENWNRMEIIARGNTLTQKINGVVFSKVTDDDSRMSRRKGVIALQDHGKGCQVAFRNIRIKELAREGK
jgi:putative heme-binding domain-containing protein